MQELLREHQAAVLFLGMIAAIVVAAIWEALFPRRPEPPDTNRRWLNNIGLALINQLNVEWFTVGATVAIAWWADERELGLLRHYEIGFWPSLVLAILVFELIAYWFHRAMHAFPWCWRIHAVHHSDTELDFTTTYRNHPLELFIIAPLTIPAVLGLGFGAEVVIAYQVLRIAISVIAHSNCRMPQAADALLRRIIVTPDYHRVHHSSDQRFTDSNFCAAFSLYDHLFGTAKAIPYEQQRTMEIGLGYFRAPEDSRVDRLLLMPFVWRRREATLASDSARPETA